MRPARWLILAAILFLVIAVASTYLGSVARSKSASVPPPKPLPAGLDASSERWEISNTSNNRKVFTIRARNFKQVKDSSHTELEDVELELYNKENDKFDRVNCGTADFDSNIKVLYSEGECSIAMAVPTDDSPAPHLLSIKSSGLRFEKDTGKASTERLARFSFDQGDGQAVGADYDPNTRRLHLRSQVQLHWRGKNPDTKPMFIEAGEAIYNENEAKVYLMPWSRLTRENLKVEAGMSFVTLENKEIRLVECQEGHGVQQDPDRTVEFDADQLAINLGDHTQVSRIIGDRNGRLVSTTRTARTTVTSDHLDLDFDVTPKESILSRAVAQGHGVVESQPIAPPGGQPAETRILRSESIQLKMRLGGQEIDNVETAGAATVEFLPNRPGQPHRFLNGDRVWITYGADNQIQSFRTVNASTRTENDSKPGPKPGQAASPVLTWSKNLVAQFDPKTSQLSRLDQSTDFRYEEGTRKARAEHAVLEQTRNVITLTGGARVWDPTGSTAADKIVMDRTSGDFTAEGNVASSRAPDQTGSSSNMLAQDEPLQAKANKMTSTNDNLLVLYEGNAVVWQGANRIQADHVAIDRDNGFLRAHGNVISQFVDKAKNNQADANKNGKKPTPSPGASVFTLVRAPDLEYNDETRVAHYSGGAVLTRPGMTVKGREITAFFKDSDSDSSLDHAFAEGNVTIAHTAAGRSRIGTSEHAEYYAGDGKVILEKGQPQLIDSLKGNTRGQQLIWFANNDRLLVNGVDSQPAVSNLRTKK